jgi:hypothetical protein
MATGAGAAAVKLRLNVGLAQCHARRAAVDHAAYGRAVRFAEVGDLEKFAYRTARHYYSILYTIITAHQESSDGILLNRV